MLASIANAVLWQETQISISFRSSRVVWSRIAVIIAVSSFLWLLRPQRLRRRSSLRWEGNSTGFGFRHVVHLVF